MANFDDRSLNKVELSSTSYVQSEFSFTGQLNSTPVLDLKGFKAFTVEYILDTRSYTFLPATFHVIVAELRESDDPTFSSFNLVDPDKINGDLTDFLYSGVAGVYFTRKVGAFNTKRYIQLHLDFEVVGQAAQPSALLSVHYSSSPEVQPNNS